MIDTLSRFFEVNNTLVFFVYGQVFFVLGLAIALQSRRHTRLELARSLGWLAAFGIAHGVHEWGAFFIPIQATHVSEAVLSFLRLLQVVLLAVSFGFLFRFGADLLRERWPVLPYVPLVVMAGWGLIFVAPNLLFGVAPETWHENASIWARYLLGFPGGMLAALGLRYQAERQIKPLNLNHIYRTLLVAGITFGAYAILAGLIVSPSGFFPASTLNDTVMVELLGTPPPVLRSVAGLIIAIAFIRALEVFDVEVDRLIEQMEIDQSVTAERERISRELHDGAIQQVYTAGLIVESAQRKAGRNGELERWLDKAMIAMNEAIGSLRATMGDLRPGPPNTSLVAGLRQQTADPRLTALMNVDLVLDLSETESLNPVQTARVLAIVSEALANAARHAQAHHVSVRAVREADQLMLTIDDDGCGFDTTTKNFGYGLRDMRDRARLLGGSLMIGSEPGRGTQIKLVTPWEDA
jgi:signal transduction histidine kinase